MLHKSEVLKCNFFVVVGAENGTANEIRNQRSGYPIFYEYDPSVLNKMLVNRVNIWIRGKFNLIVFFLN